VRQHPKPNRNSIRPHEPSPDPSRTRRERVERIRLSIANGSYHVSSADLAQKLIERMIRHPR
jgi:anti-sigma28 factor (negative regulator of flagellin synthesis)